MFRVLSISGGGYHGLLPAALLARAEGADRPPVGRHFDLLAGTSIGAIIALALAADIPAERIVTGIIEHGTTVFPRRSQGLWSPTAILLLLRKARYDGRGLRRAVESFIDPQLLMGDLDREVLIPLIRLVDGHPVMIRRGDHSHLRVVDVAMAAAAAPTYFPAVRLDGELHCDGAPFANAPDLLAMHEATHHRGLMPAEIAMLSLGTMTAHFNMSPPADRNMGILAWLRGERILKTVVATQQVLVESIMRDWLAEGYLRIDQPPGPQQALLGLDSASPEATTILQAAAHDLYEAHRTRLWALLGIESPAPARVALQV
jgi:uncharacterized protein